MGLGLIAVGFILLEGLEMQLNSVKLIPSYIAYLILFIGILVVRKKTPIKSFDIALGIGAIIYFNLIIEIPIINSTMITFVDMILRMSFYACLFYGIHQLIQDKKVFRVMASFWLIYFIIGCILLFYKLTISQDIIGVQVLALGILLMIKVILCYIIGYYLYKYNKILMEQYENNQVIQTKRHSQYKLLVVIMICIGFLIGLEKPFLKILNSASYNEYMWYGELSNEVIVEGQWIAYQKHIYGDEWDYHSPSIWINDSVYEQTDSCKAILNVGANEYTIIEQYSQLNKDYQNELLEYTGQKEGFHLIKTSQQSFDTKNLYAYRDQISLDIYLYDKQENLIQEYTVLLKNAHSRMKEYYYQDQDIFVEGMLVDHGFIMKLPYIELSHNLSDNEIIILSSSESLEKSYISIFSSTDVTYKNNKYIFNARYAHYYLPDTQNYFLHIATFENDNPHIIKTIRLEEK